MHIPTLPRKGYILRPWDKNDAGSLVIHANNLNISRNLKDGFPNPYTLTDAEKWLDMVGSKQEDIILAIEIQGEAAGGIGLHGMRDVYRYNAEIGYWLSEQYWGRGIISDAIGAMVEYAFKQTRWPRIFATVFERNLPSMKALEKNGFTKEAIHKKTVMKEGKMLDEHHYTILKEQWKHQADPNSEN